MTPAPRWSPHRADFALAQAACKTREEGLAQREAALAEQNAGLIERRQLLDEGVRQLAQDRVVAEADLKRQRGDLQAHSVTVMAERDQRRRDNEAAIKARSEKADADITAKHAAADAVIAAAQTELTRREARIIGREEAFERERSRFTALLKD